MEIDLKRQLAVSGNGSYRTDSIFDPNDHIALAAFNGKMALPHEKSYAKDRKDS